MKRIAVIGAGISGLATAYQLRKQLAEAGIDHQLRVFEKEGRPGGKITAARRQGFHCEGGPNGFLDSRPETLALCRELGLTDRLQRASEAARHRFVLLNGRLKEIPTSPLKFLASGVLSWRGKLRLLREPWAPGPPPGHDQSIAEFARRRLGEEAYQRLIDPMVAGVFAGDGERLSLASCFPRMAQMEAEYGSLVRAMFRLARQRRRGAGGPAGPGGTLTSFHGGLSELPRALAQRLGDVGYGAALARLEAREGGYRLLFEDGPPYECDGVVLATEAFQAARALAGLDLALAQVLQRFEYAPVAVVGLGFRREQLGRPLDGFGFLTPSAARRRILGSLWTSSIFPGRAPEGQVLLRTLVGGARSPELAGLAEAELVALVLEELRAILGLSGAPTFTQVFHWPRAICQYTLGHARRLEEMEGRVDRHPGLFLTGNAYRGVALNDCTANAVRVAERVREWVVGGK